MTANKISSMLRSLPGVVLWMLAAAIFAFNFTAGPGVFAAVAAIPVAFYTSRKLAQTPLRMPIMWVLSVGSWAVIMAIVSWLRGEQWYASIAGPQGTYASLELLSWFSSLFLFTNALLFTTRRYPTLLVLEATVMVAVFASVLAAHRDGSLNRPYFLSDPLQARGIDPMPILLGMGAAIACLMVVWWFSRRKEGGGTAFDPLILIACIIAGFLLLPDSVLRQLPLIAQSGGLGDGKKKPPAKGGSKGQSKDKKDQKQQDGRNQDPNPEDSNSSSRPHPVAIVNFHDDYTPPSEYYYFRQDAHSLYNGRRLIRDASGRSDNDLVNGFPTGIMNVSIPKGGRGDVKILRTTVALLTPHSRPFGLISPDSFESAQNPDPKRFQTAYFVESIVLARPPMELLYRKLGDPSWSRETWNHYTNTYTDPRFKQIGAQAISMLRGDLREQPFAQALAIKLWMDENTTYDLDAKHDGDDPVSSFLFGDRTGYCVHLSHSAVALFRSMGIPSRVAMGYAAPAKRRGKGSALLIRSGDAHAWPEVFVEGLGWVVVDISPKKVKTPPDVPVDPELQQMLGEMARKTPPTPDMQERADGGDVRNSLKSLLQNFAIGLLAAIIAMILLMYVRKIWRRAAVFFYPVEKLPVIAYRGTLDRLADLGIYRDRGETREQFAEAMASKSPVFADLTRIHLESTLGRKRQSLQRQDYLRMVRDVSRQASAGIPLFKRWLGTLIPWNWRRVG